MKNNHRLCVTLVLLCALAPPGCRTQSVRESEAIEMASSKPVECSFLESASEGPEGGTHHQDAKYLFTVPFERRDDREDLKKAFLSQGLRQDFSRANAPLSDSLSIEPAIKGWIIMDRPAVYWVEECWKALNVYRTDLVPQIHFRARFIWGRVKTFREAGIPFNRPFPVLSDEQIRAIDGLLERSKGPSAGGGLETLQPHDLTVFSGQLAQTYVATRYPIVWDYRWQQDLRDVRREYVPRGPVVGECESDGTNFVVQAHTDGRTITFDRLDGEVVDMLAWRECRARLASKDRIHWTEPVALVRRTSLSSSDVVTIPNGGTFVVVLTDEKVKQLASDARRFAKPEDIRERLMPHVRSGKKKAWDVKPDSQIFLLVKASIVNPEDTKPKEAR